MRSFKHGDFFHVFFFSHFSLAISKFKPPKRGGGLERRSPKMIPGEFFGSFDTEVLFFFSSSDSWWIETRFLFSVFRFFSNMLGALLYFNRDGCDLTETKIHFDKMRFFWGSRKKHPQNDLQLQEFTATKTRNLPKKRGFNDQTPNTAPRFSFRLGKGSTFLGEGERCMFSLGVLS